MARHFQRILRKWMKHYYAGHPHRALGPGIPHQSPPTPVSPDKRRIQAKLHV